MHALWHKKYECSYRKSWKAYEKKYIKEQIKGTAKHESPVPLSSGKPF